MFASFFLYQEIFFLTVKNNNRIFLSVNAIYAFANNQQPKQEGQMSNTYQAGLKFERINAGVYRVININGRIIANITRQTFSTNWMVKVNYLSPISKKTLSDAKSYISDPTWKHLHKSNPDKAGKFAIA